MTTDKKVTPPPTDARGKIEVSQDRLSAAVVISPPRNGGADLTLDQLTGLLAEREIVFGIESERLKALAVRPIYDEPITVAKGRDKEDGADAVLTYYVRLEKDLRPKERADGTVDFKDLGLIESVENGALLCEKQLPTAGKAGCDVMGREIPQKAGRDKPIPNGKNTRLSEDGLKLFAAMDGQTEFVNNKLHVFDSFTVNGDVSPATGDIHFSGNVVVNGGVIAGFSVQAAGDIDIHGIVESARIMAGGSLIIRGGFTSGDTGLLDVGGNLTCRFIQGGKVTVGGNLETTYILNSNISCNGSVNLTGKGLIMGGQVVARGSVTANYLGSASSAVTTLIEVGSSPQLMKRSRELPTELANCEKNIRDIEKMAKLFLQLKNAGQLTPDKAEALKKSLTFLNQLRTLRNDLEAELELITAQLADIGGSMVKVLQVAYPGVKLTICNEQFPIKTDYSFTAFRRTRDGISCTPAK